MSLKKKRFKFKIIPKPEIETDTLSKPNFNLESNEENIDLIQKYIETFTVEEKIAYEIAKSHLKTSFDIKKSIGFLEFINNQ